MAKNDKKKLETEGTKQESVLITKESFSAVCALFCIIALIMLFTKNLMFGSLGNAIHYFLTGSFGYFAYPLFFALLYLSAMTLIGKRLVKNRKAGFFITMSVLFAVLLAHTIQTVFVYGWSMDGYVKSCYFAAAQFPKLTIGGAVCAFAVHGLSSLITKIGATVLIAVLLAVCLYFSVLSVKGLTLRDVIRSAKEKSAAKKQAEKESGQATAQSQQPYAQNAEQKGFSPFGAKGNGSESELERSYQDSREFLFNATPKENFRRNLIFDPSANVNNLPSEESARPVVNSAYTPSYTEAYQNAVNNEVKESPEKILSDNTVYGTQSDPYTSPYAAEEPARNEYEPPVSSYTQPQAETLREEPYGYNDNLNYNEEVVSAQPEEREPEENGYKRQEYMELFTLSESEKTEEQDVLPERGYEREPFEEKDERLLSEDRYLPFDEERSSDRDGLNLFDEKPEDNPYELRSNYDAPLRGERGEDRSLGFEIPNEEGRGERGGDFTTGFGRSAYENTGYREERIEQPIEPVVEPPKPKKPHVPKPYKRISLDDLDCRDIEPSSNQEEIERTKETIIATLEDFKITGATIASVTFGPTVTRYNVTIPRSIQPKKVVALDQSIAINLYSSDGVNIYPNYEDGVVSIEVPNKERQFVQLGCMLSGDSYVNAKSSSLMFAMGKDVANRKVYGDISKMIHMLVAGSSGSGKSVFLGSLIISLIHKYSPEELRLILIDPKKTEFVLYNNLPHLLLDEIITDVNKAVQSLNWAIMEMNRRYGLFEQMSKTKTYVVNLDQYNAQLDKAERLPKILIIIDEMADLMLAAKKDMEEKIQNLTQKARAAGIHLVVATQRPSTDVITGVIKSNLHTRIAFGVATDVDSRVILDQSGAQKLLGKGDFLYTMQGIKIPVRVQSAFISPEESQKVVNYIKENNEAYYDDEISAYINNSRNSSAGGGGGMDKDNVESVYIDALRYVIANESASISMIQRKFSAGYNKAGKIIEWMEDMGYISAFDGARARKVLLTKEEFEKKYGPF